MTGFDSAPWTNFCPRCSLIWWGWLYFQEKIWSLHVPYSKFYISIFWFGIGTLNKVKEIEDADLWSDNHNTIQWFWTFMPDILSKGKRVSAFRKNSISFFCMNIGENSFLKMDRNFKSNFATKLICLQRFKSFSEEIIVWVCREYPQRRRNGHPWGHLRQMEQQHATQGNCSHCELHISIRPTEIHLVWQRPYSLGREGRR